MTQKELERMDYTQVGLKVGIEVHRQLDTESKMFCACPTEQKSGTDFKFVRLLRATPSELGQVDPAAAFETRRKRMVHYRANTGSVCLVEMDEEPPHPLNREAVVVGLTATLMLNSRPVDEIHVMRKIVVDGSNTTGFQRTCTLALGGHIVVDGKKVPIQSVSLEEDAARLIETGRGEVHYDLGRLGIPLVEVATGPSIRSPEEAARVALAIGRTLRATGKVKRGLGAIRQDVNISISGGALVEIKGVQTLEGVSSVVGNEVKRQLHLLRVRDELQSRGVRKQDLKPEFIDATDIFNETRCKVVRRALEAGARLLAVKLRGFGGLVGLSPAQNIRLGAELNRRAQAWSEVAGIFHTDEMPAYGITEAEVEEMKKRLDARVEDCAVFVAEEYEKARDALEVVLARAKEALEGVPEETRAPRADGSTLYSRPRPGSARMYPETDIPPVPLSSELLDQIRAGIPESLEERTKRMVKTYGLSPQLAEQLVDLERLEIFERIVARTRLPRGFVASALTEHMVTLDREGVDTSAVPDSQLEKMFQLIAEGKMAKEAAPELIRWMAQHLGKKPVEGVRELGLAPPPIDELDEQARVLVESHVEELASQPERIEGRLMGELMKQFRGKIDGKIVHETLRRKIQEKMKELKMSKAPGQRKKAY